MPSPDLLTSSTSLTSLTPSTSSNPGFHPDPDRPWGRMTRVSQKLNPGGFTLVNRTLLLILAASIGGALNAQTSALIAEGKASYNGIKNNLMKAADKMPEDAYSFKPTPDLQSFGERVAHVAGQIGTCSGLTGERKPNPATGKTSKADLVAALKASFDAC